MKPIKARIKQLPFVGNFLSQNYQHYRRFKANNFQRYQRFRIAWTYLSEPNRQMLSWLYKSRETSNFTYALSPKNRLYLASLIADISGTKYDDILGYFNELENDLSLKEHIESLVTTVADERTDPGALYGRRMGWYAFVRTYK